MAEEQVPEGIPAKLADAEALLQSAERLQERVGHRRWGLHSRLVLAAAWSLIFFIMFPVVALFSGSFRAAISDGSILVRIEIVGPWAAIAILPWLLFFTSLREELSELKQDQRALDDLVSLLAQYERSHRLDPYRSPTMREATRIRTSRLRIPPEPPRNVVREAAELFEASRARGRSLEDGEPQVSSADPTPSTKPAKATSG